LDTAERARRGHQDKRHYGWDIPGLFTTASIAQPPRLPLTAEVQQLIERRLGRGDNRPGIVPGGLPGCLVTGEGDLRCEGCAGQVGTSLHEDPPAGVTVFSFNPDLVPGTNLARELGPPARFVWRTIMPALAFTPIASRPEIAGVNLAAAAIGPSLGESGAYINRTRVESSSAESYSPEREEELWNTAERLLHREIATPMEQRLLTSMTALPVMASRAG